MVFPQLEAYTSGTVALNQGGTPEGRASAKEAPTKEPKRVLVVEDDVAFGEQLRIALEHQGWEPSVAITAEEGLERAGTERPDLIVLDIILPDLSGFELLARLKGDKRTWQVPVLMFSNLDEPEDVRHAKELGALDFLSKSRHDVATVVRRIEKFFKDGR